MPANVEAVTRITKSDVESMLSIIASDEDLKALLKEILDEMKRQQQQQDATPVRDRGRLRR
jgi:heme exporter protein D